MMGANRETGQSPKPPDGRGNPTAADLENLGEQVRARVLATSGVPLKWEILRVGIK